VAGLGPWLWPSLDYAGVPDAVKPRVIREMLTRFSTQLHRVADRAKNFIVVPMQDTLTPSEWANELHPKDPGFHKIALKFRDALQRQFGRDI
jgi:hypothetical protein